MNMDEKQPISVVLVEAKQQAHVTKITPTLEQMQAIVGGLIQCYYPFEEPVCIVCNDEGKLCGMPLNRGIYGEDGKLQDIIAGTFFICGCEGEGFSSLTSTQQKQYQKQFENPERFYKTADRIVAVPYRPTSRDEHPSR